MRAGSRLTNGYVVVAMLAAAVGGRLLDRAALLPGVHEAGAVRGGSTGWLVALLISAALGVAAATQWTRTQRLSATARVVLPGQAFAFLAAEAAVRLANGQGALDPDGFVGAGLQAGLGVVLLLALTAVWLVTERCQPLRAAGRQLPAGRQPRVRRTLRPLMRALLLMARGPPMTAGT